MNNVEILMDFLEVLKEVNPNAKIDQRDEMLLGMAINHACLIKSEEIAELKEVIRKLRHADLYLNSEK